MSKLATTQPRPNPLQTVVRNVKNMTVVAGLLAGGGLVSLYTPLGDPKPIVNTTPYRPECVIVTEHKDGTLLGNTGALADQLTGLVSQTGQALSFNTVKLTEINAKNVRPFLLALNPGDCNFQKGAIFNVPGTNFEISLGDYPVRDIVSSVTVPDSFVAHANAKTVEYKLNNPLSGLGKVTIPLTGQTYPFLPDNLTQPQTDLTAFHGATPLTDQHGNSPRNVGEVLTAVQQQQHWKQRVLSWLNVESGGIVPTRPIDFSQGSGQTVGKQ
jgi:hypothetical protein